MGLIDQFANRKYGLESPGENSELVVPNDTNDLPHASRALLCATGGAVKVMTVSGTIDTIPLVAGWNPIRVRRVYATPAPAATDIHAIW